MTALILAAAHCAIEVVLIAALAAAALLAIAAAVHPCRKADRALADVRAAQDREVPAEIVVDEIDRDWDWAFDRIVAGEL